MKNCLDVHFKGLSIIKGSVSLGWKLHCWFKHSAPSLLLSEHSFNDDICSNHWVMSQLMLSATSKVPRRDADILEEAEEGDGRVTSWTGYVREEKKMFDTSLFALPFFKPSRIQGGLCGCSVPLTSCGDWARAEIDFIYIFMYVHEKVIRETRQTVRSIGLTLVRCVFLMILIDCRALSKLT